MPLDPPDLDDRTYDQIRTELLLRIPRYTPEWTDHNPSDLGITLIELFAWLAETIGYRLNQAPERGVLRYLDVLGIKPAPAGAAEADLTFTVRDGETRPIVVPARTPVASDVRTEDGPIVFETERGLELIPLRLRSIQVGGLSGFEPIAADEAAYPPFRPFGADPQPGNALYLGFGPATAPVTFPQQITFLVDPPAGPEPADTDVRVQWEYRTDPATDRWSPLGMFVDGSRAFTRRGYVQIDGPRDSAAVAQVGQEERPMHWLRCRLVSGHYPRGQAPVVELLRYNTVPAQSLTSVTGELAGQADGRTEQVIRLRHRPVLPESVRVDVLDPAGTTPAAEGRWRVVDDLITSGPQDRDVVVDGPRGELRFGDGRTGQVPVAGFDVVVGYRYGGTALANVARDAITGLQNASAGVESVTNQRPAVHGRDEETAEDLRRRAPAALRSRDRAVTAEDYRELAGRVGGVADAVAVPLRHPAYPGTPIPGCVLVAVLARSDDRVPEASPELVEAVEEALTPARTIGTELYVRGARFVEVRVTAVVEVTPYASVGEIREEVQKRINAELSPGAGRFGQSFYPTSLFGVIQQIPDVLAVPLLRVSVDGAAQPRVESPVPIDPDQLIVPAADHDITVRPRGNP